MVREFYHRGSQGGIWGDIYSRWRHRSKPYSLGILEKILGRDLRRQMGRTGTPVLVSHPLLVPMLSDFAPVFYQHGEVVVPPEAAVRWASVVFVPLEETRQSMIKSGVPAESIFVSGLCLEPELVPGASLAVAKRKARLEESSSLVGAFFSSGAEPRSHVEMIIACLKSLEKASQKAIVFCQAGGKLESLLIRETGAGRIFPDKKGASFHESFEKNNIMAVICTSRFKEAEYTGRLFRYFDYLVAPSHERGNWALGLGLPMFILNPCIGPFAPLNRDFLLREGVGVEIESIEAGSQFAGLIQECRRDGRLLKMSDQGFGGRDINGFRNIAERLLMLAAACKV